MPFSAILSCACCVPAAATVEVQNYIDNTGVQVADVVVGFHFLENKTPDDVQSLIAAGSIRLSLLGSLCPHVVSTTKSIPKPCMARARRCMPSKPDEGVLAELAHLVADAIVQCHLTTMLRLGIEYDVLPRESEILHLQFWATAFELLKERKAIYFETEGKNKGCWVMPGSAFSNARRRATKTAR